MPVNVFPAHLTTVKPSDAVTAVVVVRIRRYLSGSNRPVGTSNRLWRRLLHDQQAAQTVLTMAQSKTGLLPQNALLVVNRRWARRELLPLVLDGTLLAARPPGCCHHARSSQRGNAVKNTIRVKLKQTTLIRRLSEMDFIPFRIVLPLTRSLRIA
jgi:hypothetical protein